MTRDIVQIGRGVSTLDEIIDAVARETGPRRQDGSRTRKRAITIAPTISNLPSKESLLSIPTKDLILFGKPAGWGLEARPQVHGRELPQAVGHDQTRLGIERRPCRTCQLFFFWSAYRIANDPRMPVWKTWARNSKRFVMLPCAPPGFNP